MCVAVQQNVVYEMVKSMARQLQRVSVKQACLVIMDVSCLQAANPAESPSPSPHLSSHSTQMHGAAHTLLWPLQPPIHPHLLRSNIVRVLISLHDQMRCDPIPYLPAGR
jgi:hypothetical protein